MNISVEKNTRNSYEPSVEGTTAGEQSIQLIDKRNQSISQNSLIEKISPIYAPSNRIGAIQSKVDKSSKIGRITALQATINSHLPVTSLKEKHPRVANTTNVIQRAEKFARVAWGVTHAVKEENESLFNSGLDGEMNPLGELTAQEIIFIDDEDVFISRRGANQEDIDNRQEQGEDWPPSYEWVRVLWLKGENVSRDNLYVRSETIKVVNKKEAMLTLTLEGDLGKFYWASFVQGDERDSREIGEHEVNKMALKNMSFGDDIDQRDDLLNKLLPGKEKEVADKTFAEQEAWDKNPQGKKPLNQVAPLKTKGSAFMQHLLSGTKEKFHGPDQDMILNCEEFVLYMLYKSGYISHEAASVAVLSASNRKSIDPINISIFRKDDAVQITGDLVPPSVGVIFEMRRGQTPQESTPGHVSLKVGPFVYELNPDTDTIDDWSSKKMAFTSYVADRAEKDLFISSI